MPDNRNLATGPARPSQPNPPGTPPAIHSAVLGRAIGVLRGLTGAAGAVSFVVIAVEMTVPAPYKPSTLIGGFHGRIEAADTQAKADAVVTFTRKNTEAAAQPPAFATMESEAFRQQQQVLAESMQTKSAIANAADAGCIIGQVIPRNNRDWGWFGDFLRSGCGLGDQVRGNMMSTLRQGGQNNSVLIERPRAGESRAEGPRAGTPSR